MNPSSHNSIFRPSGESPGSTSSEFEDTLRLIAHLPVPEGLEVRVQASLRAAPGTASIKARILPWPVSLRLDKAWGRSSLMRSAAAAAIVAIVIGGGWGVYSRVQPARPARAISVPPHVSAQGGFSSAGAMRTPQTLNGPVVAQPAIATPQPAKPALKPAVQMPLHRAKTAATSKAVSQAAEPEAGTR